MQLGVQVTAFSQLTHSCSADHYVLGIGQLPVCQINAYWLAVAQKLWHAFSPRNAVGSAIFIYWRVNNSEYWDIVVQQPH